MHTWVPGSSLSKYIDYLSRIATIAITIPNFGAHQQSVSNTAMITWRWSVSWITVDTQSATTKLLVLALALVITWNSLYICVSMWVCPWHIVGCHYTGISLWFNKMLKSIVPSIFLLRYILISTFHFNYTLSDNFVAHKIHLYLIELRDIVRDHA